MAKRARILVVDSDLHALSRIYLSLIHKEYKVEAADDATEIIPRIERFKPRLLVLSTATRNLCREVYETISKKRIAVLLINGNALEVPVASRKIEEVALPLDLHVLDERIRDLLNIVE
jgi:DNA-binding response OmpR family regulator